MKLWCYDDAHNWGTALVALANGQGVDAHLFDSVRQPDTGHLFMAMHNHPAVRHIQKRMMQQFATNPQLRLVPSYRESVLYDDKLEQLRQFATDIPKTYVFRTPTMVREFIETQPALPLISKSSEGGGVRTLRTYDDCRREVKQAFSDLGIRNKYGTRHHGYLYWQEYVGDPDYTTRVARIGLDYIVSRRSRRVDMQRTITPLTELDNDALSARRMAEEFFDRNGIRYGAVDLMPNEGNGWYVIKYTASWPMRSFFGGKFKSGRMGEETVQVLLDAIVSGAL